ncbi:MAG: hypothetical protein IMF01_09620 [Proteobacteria bacterium]|nr:hypothetical protein [Pseudomonadota bacterium]
MSDKIIKTLRVIDIIINHLDDLLPKRDASQHELNKSLMELEDCMDILKENTSTDGYCGLDPRCCKCGKADPSMSYIEANGAHTANLLIRSAEIEAKDEHMACTCERCGYEWETAVLGVSE